MVSQRTDLDGGLALTHGSAATPQVQFANLHGDIVGQALVGGAGLDSYPEATEYGFVRDVTTQPARYGWLGVKQRQSAGVTGGLTLMGVRLYNPTTGRFLSRDPVEGGNDNTYVYPADPINEYDISGACPWCIPIAFGIREGLRQLARAAARRAARKAAERAAKRAAKSCRNSFVPGTKVLLADSTTKAIEDVEVGDLVLATDPETGEMTTEEVTDLIPGEGLKYLVRVGTDPEGDGVVDWVTATSNHPFWVPAQGWTDASDLELGDQLVSDDGQLIAIMRLSETVRIATVHNLSVDRLHTYYVMAGEQSVLVHNASCPKHGHAPSGNGKSGKGRHDTGNKRRDADQKRSNNPNRRRGQEPQCTRQSHCPR